MQLTPSNPADRRSVTLRSASFLENVTADIRYRPAIWRFMAGGILVSIAIGVRAKLERTPSAETFIFSLVVAAFGVTTAIVVALFLFGHARLANRSTLKFGPDGIDEAVGDRSTLHEWDSLLKVSEDDHRVVIVFDSAYSTYSVLSLDKRTSAATIARFFELCAEHATFDIARFAQARIPARIPARPPSHDLN